MIETSVSWAAFVARHTRDKEDKGIWTKNSRKGSFSDVTGVYDFNSYRILD